MLKRTHSPSNTHAMRVRRPGCHRFVFEKPGLIAYYNLSLTDRLTDGLGSLTQKTEERYVDRYVLIFERSWYKQAQCETTLRC